MNYPVKKLAEVFQDTSGHKESAEIILSYSSNKEDIREVALKNIDFSNVRNITDLGCGFGFFTEGLCNRIENGSIVTGIDCFTEYRKSFLNICTRCGFRGNFYNSGTEALRQFLPNSIDLVLSSYSLYFFPEILPELVKLLNYSATCVFITHSNSHLKEITHSVLNTFQKNNYRQIKKLPHDELIGNFTGENGYQKLSKFFNTIQKEEYLNDLVFTAQSSEEFLKYFRYKRSFFIPEVLRNDLKLFRKTEEELLNQINSKEKFRITKNDTIFICSNPIKK